MTKLGSLPASESFCYQRHVLIAPTDIIKAHGGFEEKLRLAVERRGHGIDCIPVLGFIADQSTVEWLAPNDGGWHIIPPFESAWYIHHVIIS